MTVIDLNHEDVEPTQRELPKGWRWARLDEISTINPQKPSNFTRDPDALTTFVPMAAVDAELGQITEAEYKPFAEVERGYTYFAEGDILFAKITPCMQNKKSAIARGLIDGVGFGTTEFHVIRPGNGVLAEWIYYQVRESRFLALAEANFTGAVGQQRVPASFLAQFTIPLPPVEEQRTIVRQLERDMNEVERLRAEALRQYEAVEALPAAYLRETFETLEAQEWPQVRLGDVLVLRKDVIHPYNEPSGTATFVGLEHIESHTGQRIGSLPVEMSKLTGRKPQFFQGDIVYGYLRPYLNKVWIAEFDGLCSVDQYVFTVKQELVETQFVAAFMRSQVYLDRAPIDTTPGQLPRIRTDEVFSVKMSLPSLAEQQQIIRKLNADMSEVFSLREAAYRNYDTIDAFPNALLREVFGDFRS